MFTVHFRNLSILLCLVLYAMPTVCMGCLLGDGKEQSRGNEQLFALINSSPGEPDNCCSFCEAKQRIGKFYRFVPNNSHDQSPVIMQRKDIPRHDDAVTYSIATLHIDFVPSPSIQELQVVRE